MISSFKVPVLFGFTDASGWRPGIGDPTVMGWVTAAAYLAAAAVCARTALRIAASGRSPEIRFWGLLGVALLLLGINKQLDLQTWLTLAGKRLAIAQGWYEQRRILQVLFVLGIFGAGLWSLRWMWRNLRMAPSADWIALAGFTFLACFVLIRAASFHHVDAFLKWGPGDVRMNWVLELGGILMLAYGAARRAYAIGPNGRFEPQPFWGGNKKADAPSV